MHKPDGVSEFSLNGLLMAPIRKVWQAFSEPSPQDTGCSDGGHLSDFGRWGLGGRDCLY